MRKLMVLCGVAAVAAGVLVSPAAALTLYDGSSNTAPESQGWLAYYSFPGNATRTIAGGKMTYDSNALIGEQGGVANHTLLGTLVNGAFPALDRTAGYTISLDLKLLNETHASSDRAGLSIIAISSDQQGIELGFWDNEIWAQSGPAFTHAEGVGYDTTAANPTYDLTISGSSYRLAADGTVILSGPLRDYSSFGTPYNISNLLFIGDDTTSARGAWELSRVAVPEPASTVVLVGLIAVLRRR